MIHGIACCVWYQTQEGRDRQAEVWMEVWVDQGIGAWVARRVGGKRRVGGMTEEWGQELFSRNGDEFRVRHFPFGKGI